MIDKIEGILDYIERFEPHAREALLPGATVQEIEEFEHQIGFKIPENIRALYAFSKGVDEDRQSEEPVIISFPGLFSYYMMSLSELEEVIYDFIACKYIHIMDSFRFLPVFTDGGSNYICIDLNSSEVIFFRECELSIYVSNVEYGDIMSMMNCILHYYSDGAIVFLEGELHEDMDKIAMIKEKFGFSNVPTYD